MEFSSAESNARPKESSDTATMDPCRQPRDVLELGSCDVLCGRDKTSFNHEGNKKFRGIIHRHLTQYRTANRRSEKAVIAEQIENTVAEMGGRFLRLDSRGVFHCLDERERREKVTHALRDAFKKITGTTGGAAAAAKKKTMAVEKGGAAAAAAASELGGHQEQAGGAMTMEQEQARREIAMEMALMNPDLDILPKTERFTLPGTSRAQQQAMARLGGGDMGDVCGSLLGRSAFPMDPYLAAAAASMTPDPEIRARHYDPDGNPVGGGSTALQSSAWLDTSVGGEPVTLPPLEEQVRILTVMLGIRHKEIETLKLLLWRTSSGAAAKTQEIQRLKAELALKDQAFQTERRLNAGDPPEG